ADGLICGNHITRMVFSRNQGINVAPGAYRRGSVASKTGVDTAYEDRSVRRDFLSTFVEVHPTAYGDSDAEFLQAIQRSAIDALHMRHCPSQRRQWGFLVYLFPQACHACLVLQAAGMLLKCPATFSDELQRCLILASGLAFSIPVRISDLLSD